VLKINATLGHYSRHAAQIIGSKNDKV